MQFTQYTFISIFRSLTKCMGNTGNRKSTPYPKGAYPPEEEVDM